MLILAGCAGVLPTDGLDGGATDGTGAGEAADQRLADESIDTVPGDSTAHDAKPADSAPPAHSVPPADSATPFSLTVTDRRIATDSQKVKTPCTWNAHLPKLVTDGSWSYAVFTRYTPGYSGRVSWIYRAKGVGAWSYSGRTLSYVHQPPGLALDTKGRLHVIFSCLAGYTCSTAGVYAGKTTRFYDLIFYKKNKNGSVFLGDAFANYNEYTSASLGYMGIGVDPVGGAATVSLGTSNQPSTKSHFTQRLFKAGAASPALTTVPKVSGASANTLYPQLAFTPAGTLFLSVGELVPGWTSSAQYSHVALFKRKAGGVLTKVFSDSVTNPSNTMLVFTSDLALSSTGKVYFLYLKLPADSNGNCNFLVRELASGVFSKPLGVGCPGSYTQLQLDSKDNLHLLTTSGKQLLLLRSTDGGKSFTKRLITLKQLAVGTKYLQSPTLVKPWSSPKGYDPDVLYGLYSGADAGHNSWYAGSFRIVLNNP